MAVLLAALFLAACGGANSSASSSTPTTSLTIPPLTTTSQTSATETTVTLTQTATAATSTGAVNARVPATFTIKPGGAVTPPTITVPPQFPVQLTVISADGREHHAVLHGESLVVPARGKASTLIRGLRAGSYPLELDGARRGVLVIGGAPGP
jgi:hypothetical protein